MREPRVFVEEKKVFVKEKREKKKNNDVSCSGCLGLILAVIGLWALFFGVTWGGTHYKLDCSCDQGVQLLQKTVEPLKTVPRLEQ